MTSAARSYEAEQAKLRRQYDGGGKDELRIDPPKPPELNPELLKDVEPLLFRGFLYLPAEINGVSFVFKSLNHHEYERINLLASLDSHHPKFYNLFLAYGVLMVDGVNILPERDQWIPEVSAMFQGLDEMARRKVIRYLSEINRRASRAVVLTEAYCMEPRSRLRWSQYRELDLTSPAVTGFSGTQHVGMNWAQLTWRAVNYYEDLHTTAEREWENAKFIAGAFAGSKGLSSVNAQDKQRREKEQNERIARRDEIVRTAVFGQSKQEGPIKGVPMKVARSVEELADQLEKDLKGEKDWHDQVVEEHERKAQQAYEDRMSQLQEFREAHVERYGDKPIIGGTDVLEGLTQEDVQRRMRKRQQATIERLSSTQSPQAYPEFDPKLAPVRQKWAHRVKPK
jgi:hypothetical protein